jgi:hypothetical protein
MGESLDHGVLVLHRSTMRMLTGIVYKTYSKIVYFCLRLIFERTLESCESFEEVSRGE